jgi:hypothetical protein
MKIILIVLVIYIVSVLRTRKWIQKAHSERGIWSRFAPDSRDGYMVLFPLLNTVFAIMMIFMSPLCDRKTIDWNKFFNVNN